VEDIFSIDCKAKNYTLNGARFLMLLVHAIFDNMSKLKSARLP